MPGLDFGDAPPWLQWLLGAIAIAAFVGGAIKGIPPAWRVVSRFVTTVNALGDLPDELAKQKQFRADTSATLTAQSATLKAQDQKIAEIHHETHENNGTSIKDSAKRIETGVEGLYRRVDTVDTSLEGVHGRLDGVDRQIAELQQSDVDLRRDFEDNNTQPKE